MGFEPMMRVLQTLALPLGDVARVYNILAGTQWLARNHHASRLLETRAGDGIRTHDLLLGKETYYRCTTPAFGDYCHMLLRTLSKRFSLYLFSR